MYAVYACVLWNRGGARSAPPEDSSIYIYIQVGFATYRRTSWFLGVRCTREVFPNLRGVPLHDLLFNVFSSKSEGFRGGGYLESVPGV